MESFQDLLIKSSLPFADAIHERNIINFFVCSAFEDFEIERKILNTRVFTKVREQCFNEFGIEIKLIDVKLGLDSFHEVTKSYQHVFNDYLKKHGISDKYNCPIILFGQKYGKFIIPIRLPLKIYELFITTIKRHKKRFQVDESFLNLYYTYDLNCIESEMVLLDIQEIFPDLYAKDKNSIKSCREEWTKTKYILSDIFQKLLNICLSNGSLDIATATKLFVNELESSISETIRKSLNSEFSPIIFSREIIDIKNFIEISNINKDHKRMAAIEKLIDVSYNDKNQLIINEDSEVLLKQCYNSCYEIYENIDPKLKILWKDETGISEKHHKLYIEQIELDFSEKIYKEVSQRAIKMNLELSPSILKCYDMVCNANILKNKFSKFGCGYEDICMALLEYLSDDNMHIPFILYGPPNSGKAIVFARTILEFQSSQQNIADYHIITRFINSTKSSINEVLMSLFLQISAIILTEAQFNKILKNSKEIENNIPKDLEGILFSFQQQTKKFIIVLHDLEKCSDLNSHINFIDLIPKLLPDNMKLIISSTEQWDSRTNYFLNFLVPEFSQTEYNIFIQTQLNNLGRYLSEKQNDKLLPKYLNFTNDILTAAILVNYLNKYNLSTNSNEEEVHCQSLTEFYDLNLNRWYKMFGKILISHSLLFIYCSQGGLTDQEMIEILNIDEEVIRELDNIHSESLICDNETLKFPLSLWLLIKEELSSVLIEKMVDGYLLVDLATYGLVESLIKEKENDVNQFHKILAEYFLGTWVSSKKDLSFDLTNGKNSYFSYPKVQRMYSKHGRNVFYNYRKFRQLVRHLNTIGMYEELLTNVIFNFDWLYNKTKALRVAELLEDFQLIKDDGKEIALLEESFRNSAVIIENDLDSLAGELIMQLLPYVPYYPNLRVLIENCDQVAPKHNAFIPIYPTNKLPGSPLVSTIKCPVAIESVLVAKNIENTNSELLIKLKNDSNVYFYDLSYREISHSKLLSSGQIILGPNNDIILVLESDFKQIIKVHQKDTGDLIGQIIPMNWVILRPFEERNKYKITNIDITQTRIALIITNEVSYLFVINLDTLEPILAFSPEVRLEMLKLTLDESTVFTHLGEKLVSILIENNQLNSAVELQGTPSQMLFPKDQSKKAFIVCNRQKSVIVVDLESNGVVRKCYKIYFESYLDENDYVLEVSCSEIGNPYLLIRACHSVILYDWTRENVLSHITQPDQLPLYFKLPNQRENQPVGLQFNAAKLILSDKAIVCALFRDIIVCAICDNTILKTLHAPVGGIVSEIHITDNYIIGRVEENPNTAEVMIWNTDPSCLFSKIETSQDKLTKSVNKIQIGTAVAIAVCEQSDEMGVLQISTGTLVDLYSHAAVVINCCISSCGNWALVTVDNVHNANVLWSLDTRKIVFEFGTSTTTVYSVPLTSISGFLSVTNHSKSINSPKFIVTQIICDSNTEILFTVKILEITNLGFICENPCVLNGDRNLIFLTNDYQIENGNLVIKKNLIIWSRENNTNQSGISFIITTDNLSKQINRPIENLLTIKTTSKENIILVFYKTKDHEVDILCFDCKSKLIIQFLELFKLLPKQLDYKDFFPSNSGTYLFYQNTCSVINLLTGTIIGNISSDVNIEYEFRCFALKDTILVLSQKTKLFAWRLPEICKIGQIELKEEISCVSKCQDDYTIMIGCLDGSILSYSLIDIYSPSGLLSQIKIVRNFQPQSRSPTIQLEPITSRNKSIFSEEFDNLIINKRPISEPIVAYGRREFSNIF